MKWFNDTLIHSPVQYGLSISEQDFKKNLKFLKTPRDEWPRYLLTETAIATTHFLRKGKDDFALVCVEHPTEKDAIQIAAILVHEAVHIWQHICARIGEQEPSSEFEAYAIQRISQNLMFGYAESIAAEGAKL